MGINRSGNPAKLTLSITLALAATLTLSGCGGAASGASEDKPPAATAEPTKTPEAKADSFPVGEPFEEAVWTIESGLPSQGTTVQTRDIPVHVRGDRLVVETLSVDGTRGVSVFDADGEEVWQQPISDAAQVTVLQETVALLDSATVEGEGLEKASTATVLTLLSLDDGATVTEFDSEEMWPIPVSTSGQVMLLDGWVSEDGEMHPGEEPGPVVPTDEAQIPELADEFRTELRVYAPRLDIAVWNIGHGATVENVLYAVKGDGNAIGPVDCGDVRYVEHTNSDSTVAVSSPNGDYAVHEAFWVSRDGAKCYAENDDAKGVDFTAVDDDGTAYGLTSASDGMNDELVAVTADGKATVSPLPDGATPPIGILDGGIAVHVKDGVITGNPIK